MQTECLHCPSAAGINCLALFFFFLLISSASEVKEMFKGPVKRACVGLVEFLMIITRHSDMVLCICFFPVYIIHLARAIV